MERMRPFIEQFSLSTDNTHRKAVDDFVWMSGRGMVWLFALCRTPHGGFVCFCADHRNRAVLAVELEQELVAFGSNTYLIKKKE